MNIVDISHRVFVIHKAGPNGKKSLARDTCSICETPAAVRVAFGPNANGCMKCLRAAIVELAEATGARLKITTEIDGVEQTTFVNIDHYEDRDE